MKLTHRLIVFAIGFALLSQTFSAIGVSAKITELKIPGDITEFASPESFDVEVEALPTTIQFSSSSYVVGEGGGRVDVTVTRTGDTSSAASVKYASSDTSAIDRSDYLAALGTLHFQRRRDIENYSRLHCRRLLRLKVWRSLLSVSATHQAQR